MLLPVTFPTFVAPLKVRISPMKEILPPFALMEFELPSTTPTTPLFVLVPHEEKFRLNCPTGELIAVPLPVMMRPPLNARVALAPDVFVIVGATMVFSQ